MRRLTTHGIGLLSVVALAFSAAGCSSDDQQQAEQRTEDIAGDVRQAGEDAGQTVESLTDEARSAMDRAREQLNDESSGVRETAVRNAVAQAAGGEFERRGVTLDGTPECSATSPAMGEYSVTCTGRTDDGREATLVGEDPGEGPSEFVGSVDGDELFRQECVGLC
jgi:hypothetical protein